MLDTPCFTEFESAARAVLAFLHARLGFGLWMVTRTEGDDWVVLQAEDHGYGVAEGTVFRWAESFCSQMVAGRGPRVAPCSTEVEAYAAAPIGRQVAIGAYVGVPLTQPDGSLFGTLCAIDPTPQPESIVAELPLVELLAGLLGGVLAAEMGAAEQARRTERAEAEAWIDPLTGLYNRRGWDRLVTAEESRCRRFGHPACVLSIDLDGLKGVNDSEGHAAGDEVIRRAAGAISGAVRGQDIAARLGGDEFAVVGVESDAAGARALLERVRAALAAAKVEASVGVAMRGAGRDFTAAMRDADAAMYTSKRARRAESRPPRRGPA